jgi:mannose-6-phosphate isomerase-like protein (cupin superfamily)
MHARFVLRVSVLTLWPALALAQSPKAATYLTDEQVKAINSLPGVDRQIVTTDIGKLNLSVGIVHRGSTNAPAPGATGAAGAAGATGAAAAAQQGEACGETRSAAAAAGTASGISHDGQTETYIIVSGGGTLVTGGKIVNGRKSGPDSPVTKVLNGPSCSGRIEGADVVKKVVKTGDIIIIPAGVPHGWIDITDHVDYLSVRPDPDRLLAPYVNPALKR